MRDETIRVGDMVHAVWGCCAGTRAAIGEAFEVIELRESQCTRCGECGTHHHLVAHVHIINERIEGIAPRSWFKKIHPDERATQDERVAEYEQMR